MLKLRVDLCFESYGLHYQHLSLDMIQATRILTPDE
jgi:hypothetical protein